MPLASDAPAGEAMLEHLHAAGLSKFDMPEYYIGMDAFPLTASGKILKRELADWARTGRIRPAPGRFADPEQRKAARGMILGLTRRDECAVHTLHRPEALN